MKRLTEKINGKWQTNGKANIDYIDTNESVFVGKAIDKLAEFEDFMEEQGFESLDNLQNYINKIYKYELGVRKQFVKEINEEEFFNMKDENQKLKDRWQKLKEWLSDRRSENGSKYFDNEMIEDDNILDKMQELEKDD